MQAYALQQCILNAGHDVKILHRSLSSKQTFVSKIKKILKTIISPIPNYTKDFPYAYASGITIGDDCVNCKYTTTKRCSDITLGDYVGDISDIANESSILLRAGQELIGLDGIEGLEKAISELEEKILKARSDYMDAVANQNETMANQYLASIESWSDQIQLYQRQIDEFEKNRDMVYARNWELEGEKEARLEASARAVERAMREAEMGAFANNFRNRMYYRFGYGSEVVYEPFKGLTTK